MVKKDIRWSSCNPDLGAVIDIFFYPRSVLAAFNALREPLVIESDLFRQRHKPRQGKAFAVQEVVRSQTVAPAERISSHLVSALRGLGLFLGARIVKAQRKWR